MTETYPIHPIAEASARPPTYEEMRRLTRSIAAEGQRTPILLFEGQVLDGARRQAACVALGIEPRYVTVSSS